MNLTEVSRNEDSSIKFKLDFETDEIDSLRFKEYNKIKSFVRLNGFRKGKVPIKIAERTLGIKSIYGKKMNNLFSKEAFDKGYKLFSILDLEINKDFSVDITAVPLQDVKFSSDVKSLYVVKEKTEASQEEIDLAKKSLFKEYATRIEADKDYESTNEDELLIRVTAKNIDKDQVVAEDSKVKITMGIKSTQLDQYLIGMKTGEHRSFRCVIGDDEYEYNIDCDGIYRLQDPTEEELLEKINLKSIEELETSIRTEINKQKQQSKYTLMETLYEKLENNSDFSLNNKLGDSLTKHITSDVEKRLVKDIITKNYRSDSLLISAANSLNISVDDQEIENEIQTMKLRREIKEVEVNDITKIDVRKRLLKKKVTDLLIKEKE